MDAQIQTAKRNNKKQVLVLCTCVRQTTFIFNGSCCVLFFCHLQKERNKGKSTPSSNPKQPGASTAAFAIARKKQTKTSKEAGQKNKDGGRKGRNEGS
jgi:hypothetical protein